MIRLLVCDLDGTLFYKHGETVFDLSKEAISALKLAKENNLLVAFASGRMISYGQKLASMYNFEPQLCCGFNGAVASINQKLIYSYGIKYDVLVRIMDLFFNNKDVSMIQFQTLDNGRYFSRLDGAYFTKARAFSDKYHLDYISEVPINSVDLKKLDVGKISITFSSISAADRYAPIIETKFSKSLEVNRINDFLFEITSMNSNKGTFLFNVSRKLSIKTNEIATIGDGENDLSMFLFDSLNMAMSSGSERLKSKANFIVDNVEDAVKHCLFS